MDVIEKSTVMFDFTVEKDWQYLVGIRVEAHSLREAVEILVDKGFSERQIIRWEVR